MTLLHKFLSETHVNFGVCTREGLAGNRACFVCPIDLGKSVSATRSRCATCVSTSGVDTDGNDRCEADVVLHQPISACPKCRHGSSVDQRSTCV